MNSKRKAKSARRSLLFTPGDSIRKIEKAAQVNADTVILDLEDAVTVDQKEAARLSIANALTSLDFGRTECLVRINGSNTDFYTADLEALARTNLDGIVLPKVEEAEQLRRVDEYLTVSERATGRPVGTISLLALIETARGVMNLKEIGQSCRRLSGLLFGAEDLAADLGAIRSSAGWEVFYGRSAVVTAAAAYRLEAIDTVYLELGDLSGLEEDALFAKRMGYTGKMAIHPRQVGVINRVFSPTAAEIMQAERLLAAYESHAAAGSGVFALDGRMVDKVIVVAAERLLEKARLCGLLAK